MEGNEPTDINDRERIADIASRAAAQITRSRFTTWHSTGPRLRKHHLVRDCEGLVHVPDGAVGRARFSSAGALLRAPSSRPCRRCALEAATVAAWTANWRGGQVAITLCPLEPLTEKKADITPSRSADDRMRRIAAKLGWAGCETVAGYTTWTTAPQSLAKLLEHNYRMLYIPDGLAVDAETIQAVWYLTLTNDDAGHVGGCGVWDVAVAVSH